MGARTASLLGWAVAFGLVFAWQGVTLAKRDAGWLPLTEIVEAVRLPVVRWVAFALWLWVGWHVFVRTWEILPGK